MDELFKLIQDNLLASLVAAFVLGGGAAWPLIRRAAEATPTQVDDMICAVIDKLIQSRRPEIDKLTVEQLDKLITADQLRALVELRNARVRAKKAAAVAG